METTRVVKQVRVKIGTWEEMTDLIIVKMNGFAMVLGMVFLVEKDVIPIPSMVSLLIIGEKLVVVSTKMKQALEEKLLLAFQFKKGVKR